tara:strand:- start:1594 stop:1938 length:345 start_codon:yes stop_codon:yes gene_type:complete
MTTINNTNVTTRDIYTSHKLYLEKRTGSRYYNLGYMMYKEIINDTAAATLSNLQDAITNFEVALLFDKNDINAILLKNELCDKYGPNSVSPIFTTSNISTYKNNAKKTYRNCKC